MIRLFGSLTLLLIYKSAFLSSFSIKQQPYNHQSQTQTPTSNRRMAHQNGTTGTSSSSSSSSSSYGKPQKKIILIRHGCTYMNEYLSTPGSRWGDPNFTDIFQSNDLYKDSPLSEKGIQQASELYKSLELSSSSSSLLAQEDCDNNHCHILNQIDLIVVSPLTRAIQTANIALFPFIFKNNHTNNNNDGCDNANNNYHDENQNDYNNNNQNNGPIFPSSNHHTNNYNQNNNINKIPIIALPLATERVYLISDIGTPTHILSQRYNYIDFTSEFNNEMKRNEWWFTPNNSNYNNDNNNNNSNSEINKVQYKEWRPNTQGQTYACPGEPELEFRKRMMELYDWLNGREESCICIVSHWGVLQYFTGEDFRNCEMKVFDFDQLKRDGFMVPDEELEAFVKKHRK